MKVSVRLPTSERKAAFVKPVTSSVTSKYPYAPEPRACTTRSGIRSRLKRASFSSRCWSWRRRGPPTPAVAEFWLSATGAPDSVVSTRCDIVTFRTGAALCDGARSVGTPSEKRQQFVENEVWCSGRRRRLGATGQLSAPPPTGNRGPRGSGGGVRPAGRRGARRRAAGPSGPGRRRPARAGRRRAGRRPRRPEGRHPRCGRRR